MNVLAFNPGSNSLKFQIIDQAYGTWGRKLVVGVIEPIGPDAKLTTTVVGQGTATEEKSPVDHPSTAASRVLDKVKDGAFHAAGIRGLSDIQLIACRVVHGALRFQKPALVDTDVLKGIEELDELAPLHNAQSVAIIRVCLDLDPKIPVIAVFDSAFHSTLPEIAYRYAIDYELADRHAVRRYGFHGISHRYLLLRYAEIQAVAPADLNVITLHLEGGCSATAIK